MTRARIRLTVAAATGVIASLVGVGMTTSAAHATFHGRDGRIAFVRHHQIYTVNPDGTGIRRLTTSGQNLHPKWSPNGRRLAYVHETAAGATDLWVMRATGSRKRQVTHVGNATEPTWAPGGKYLAFGGGAGGVVLEKIRSTAPFGQPTVLLAYETNPDNVTLCDLDGQPPATDPLNVDRFVAWSPDGSRIAVYNHDDCELDDSIFMYHPATGEASEYAAIGGACCGEADWSDLTWGPGGQFGYASVDFFDGPPQPSTVVYPGYAGKPGDAGPAPDPAGSKIAVENASSGTAKLFIQAVNGAHRRFLEVGSEPDWQSR
jgi:dipeptidyl aminopeptidase/acylaminoacyl peptidase